MNKGIIGTRALEKGEKNRSDRGGLFIQVVGA